MGMSIAAMSRVALLAMTVASLSAAEEKMPIVFEDDFSNPAAWTVTAHRDATPAGADGLGIRFGPSTSAQYEGRRPGRLHCAFPTSGEDAAMITRDVALPRGNMLTLTASGDESNHQLFAVFEDASGERHFFPVGGLFWKGWKTFSVQFDHLTRSPGKHVIEATHYGGDGNQVIDYPIRKLTLGLSDREDAFVGKGELVLARVRISHVETAGPNLLRNPSFEIGLESPDHWRSYTGTVPGEYPWLTDGHAGLRSICVKGDTNAYHGGWNQSVSLKPGALYRFSGWARGNVTAGTGQVMRCDIYDGQRRYYGFVAGALRGKSDWTRHGTLIMMPSDGHATAYPLLLYGQGEIVADHVRMEEIALPYLNVSGSNVELAVRGGLFVVSPTGILVSGDGVKTHLSFSARVRDADRLDIAGLKRHEIIADSARGKTVTCVYSVSVKGKAQARPEASGWELERELSARLVANTPCLFVTTRLKNLGGPGKAAISYAVPGAQRIALPSGEKLALDASGDLPPQRWCYVELGKANRNAATSPGLGLIPTGARIAKAAKRVDVLAPVRDNAVGQGASLTFAFVVVAVADVGKLERVGQALGAGKQ